jgi:D-beta-D-heptose 7-phosphate kinase/D-beta-D-heptose 1-phosphate adenosyltransferase
MHIIVLGDVMLDRNYFGRTTRVAPEAAHVPIYQIDRTETLLGGAANVGKNLGNLPGVTVDLLTVVGEDAAATELTGLLAPSVRPGFLPDRNRQTTVKHRIFDAATGALVNRYDCEAVVPIATDLEDALLARIEKTLNLDAVVLVDYNKGVLTPRLAAAVIAQANARGIPTFVDPKLNDYLKYRQCFCFKPNLHEGQVLTGQVQPRDVLAALRSALDPRCIVLTCGAEGLYLDGAVLEPFHVTHAAPVPVVDVTGAGDTAMSTLVYMYCRYKCMRTACLAANRICGQSIQCIGNYTLSATDFDPVEVPERGEEVPERGVEVPERGEEVPERGEEVPERGEEVPERGEEVPEKVLPAERKTIFSSPPGRIVFTNGCFDLIHAAHIQLLTFAKQQGDVLIVGLNSDASVRRLKGPSRPINPEKDRQALLESLPCVDYVVLFDEDTPAELIKALRPHVLVKGGDYALETIVGREDVEEVRRFAYQPGRSSTTMVNRILRNQDIFAV